MDGERKENYVHNVHIASYLQTKFHVPCFVFLGYHRIQIFSGLTDGRTEGKMYYFIILSGLFFPEKQQHMLCLKY